MKPAQALVVCAALSALCPRAARAGEIVVVTPESPMAPYQEALQGVCDALGSCPPVLTAGRKLAIPPEARIVIALGGRAARLSYPARVALVTALVPGYDARPTEAVVHVRLTYSPREFARRIRRHQPEARRALLLWSTAQSGAYARDVRAAAAELGLDAVPVEVSDVEELPALLRGLPASEAVWLAPDAGLVTASTFDAVREYARMRGAVFYAPAAGLAARGADAELAPSFREAGLRAGIAAREILSGAPSPSEEYPDQASEDVKTSAPLVSTRTLVETPR
jgi:hypothetical protein